MDSGHETHQERLKIACANHLGIEPRRISSVDITLDGGGHFTGVNVILHIATGRGLRQFIESNLTPQEPPTVEE